MQSIDSRRAGGTPRLVVGARGIALAVGVALSLFPIIWLVGASIKPSGQVFRRQVTLLPLHPTFENYRQAAQLLPLGRNLWNSVFIAGMSTLGALFFCSLAGFAFAKFRFPGKNLLFFALLGTMMIPRELGIVPTFVIMSRLHLVNTPWSLIFPDAANAFGIFFMRQYIATIPTEILDAAEIDGCSDFRKYWSIVLPLARPGLGALGILIFAGAWNDFLWPSVMLRTRETHTIMLAIPTLLGSAGFETPWGAITAASVIAFLPMLVVFLLFQRSFVSGIAAGGVKE